MKMKERLGKYVLDAQGRPKPEPDLMKWATWFETAERVVKRETVGGCEVSTIFLGIDHNHSTGGPPVVWESMVFGGEMDQCCIRCAGNREQAEAMHAQMVETVKAKVRKRKARK
jgi:hypothetical protein